MGCSSCESRPEVEQACHARAIPIWGTMALMLLSLIQLTEEGVE